MANVDCTHYAAVKNLGVWVDHLIHNMEEVRPIFSLSLSLSPVHLPFNSSAYVSGRHSNVVHTYIGQLYFQ